MIKAVILVGLGGGIGSILRYLISVFINKNFQQTFPLATFITNILGCLAIGLLIGFIERLQLTNSDFKNLFIIGFCGGFTTFSTFALENMNLFQSNNSLTAFLYIAASVLSCLFAVWIGLTLTKL